MAATTAQSMGTLPSGTGICTTAPDIFYLPELVSGKSFFSNVIYVEILSLLDTVYQLVSYKILKMNCKCCFFFVNIGFRFSLFSPKRKCMKSNMILFLLFVIIHVMQRQ